MNKKGYRLSHVIIIIITTSIISAITTGIIVTSSLSANGTSYTDLVLDENVQQFLDVYDKLTNDYYEDINKKAMIDSAIDAMTSYLDETYTTYLDSDNASTLKQELNGKYTGIGITIRDSEVISIASGSPADRSGIKLGDKIKNINGKEVEDLNSNEISDLIKQNGENVIINIERNGENLEYSMQVEEFDISPVEYKMIENTSIGYIKMSIFSTKLYNDSINAISDLKKQGMNKLIIDLRNNTGGFLDQAKSVASLFLEKGKIIYYLENKNELEEEKDETVEMLDVPVVVLVNSSTASAAEILTGALKYSYNATLVGTKTYGKGKVQHTISLNNNDMVKYTSSRWLMPNKNCIDEIGIIPDYVVENEYIYDKENPTIIQQIIDNQLNKAIELLS